VKNLKDTPFSIERLFVWTIGICLLIAVTMTAVMSYQGKTIPPQLQSIVMLSLGVFAARIEKQTTK
jgi:hypothetical protein